MYFYSCYHISKNQRLNSQNQPEIIINQMKDEQALPQENQDTKVL